MRVVENTPERLVLRDIPLGPGAALLAVALLPMLWGWALARAGQMTGGLFLIGFGVIIFLGCFGVFVQVLTVRLDRAADHAEITQTGIFGRRQTIHSLADLTGATLQSTLIRRKPGDRIGKAGRRLPPEPRVWRTALVRRDGTHLPLTEAYGSQKTAGALAAALNGWFGAD
ncbi:hypothetical protein L0V05_01580 [Tabrizicola sp. J26]|uniref:hypothetical protein n=1 Tax=Alitabrizicola rongguiensis TaxID=2909234 RepID=UPI001F344743|nr:hypothetical protein [Tabrizicola rongguiensis]MCF1707498.1 hypothetical protein [Tabrizicola rongguiensis]